MSLQKQNTLPALTLKKVKMCLCNDCYYSKHETQMENYLLYLIPDLWTPKKEYSIDFFLLKRFLFSFKRSIESFFSIHRWNLLRTFKRDIIVYIFVKIISHICIKTHFKTFLWNFNTFLDRKLRIFCFGHYLFHHCHSLSSFSSLSYFRVLSLWSPEVGDKTRRRPACTRYRCNTSLPGCVCSAKVKL